MRPSIRTDPVGAAKRVHGQRAAGGSCGGKRKEKGGDKDEQFSNHHSILRPAEVKHGLEVVAAISLEGDEGAGFDDPWMAEDSSGDDFGQLIVVPDPDNRHQVGVAGDGLHLGHTVDLGQFTGEIGDPCRLRVDQHEGMNHRRNATAGKTVVRVAS